MDVSTKCKNDEAKPRVTIILEGLFPEAVQSLPSFDPEAPHVIKEIARYGAMCIDIYIYMYI